MSETIKNSSEIARIKLSNNQQLISPLNLFAEQIAKINGFSDDYVMKIQLIIEETVLNIIDNSFDEGEKGYFEVIFERKPNVFIISFEDKGLPYDLAKFEKTDNSSLRLLLMKSFADELHFMNLGKNGKRIELHIHIPHKNIDHYFDAQTKILEKDVEKDERPIELTMMTKNLAIDLSRCVYRSYGYTYISEFIYFPEKITELLESGLLKSCIALNADGEVVAHLGLNFTSTDSKVGETGQAVVDPRYRGRGLFEKMKKYLAEHESERGNYGFYSEAVSIHPYTQKGNISLGAVETGVLLGYIPETILFKKIHENQQPQRQSAVLFYLKVSEEPHRTVFLPEVHSEIIKEIYSRLNLNRTLSSISEQSEPASPTILEVIIKPESGQAFIQIKEYGDDFVQVIFNNLKNIRQRKIDCIYLDLPLSDSLTPVMFAKIKNIGFFFSGIIPELFKGDVLRLQFLNNMVINRESITVASDFGRKLLDYIFNDLEKVSETRL